MCCGDVQPRWVSPGLGRCVAYQAPRRRNTMPESAVTVVGILQVPVALLVVCFVARHTRVPRGPAHLRPEAKTTPARSAPPPSLLQPTARQSCPVRRDPAKSRGTSGNSRFQLLAVRSSQDRCGNSGTTFPRLLSLPLSPPSCAIVVSRYLCVRGARASRAAPRFHLLARSFSKACL